MRAPTTIRIQMDLVEYKRFIRNHIIQMQQRTIMDNKEKIVGIFSIMIQMFRLPHAGAGDIKAEGSAIAAKRYKEHSRIAEAKRLFQRIYGKKIDDNYQRKQRQPQRQLIKAVNIYGANIEETN
ncbi:MAG: hypothetical protein EZS28_014343 [Streblomastix strix]|uniref:Uncharacterized protein n=1 Tax=Streblomastix strix TaxID=222440 RepID=A0A5J4W5T8_9EUKA|nr:MAG: hypothetical protein EZS28_014343 [Streblomastix strix]